MTSNHTRRLGALRLLAAVITVSTMAGCAAWPIAGIAAPTAGRPGTTVVTTTGTTVTTAGTAQRPANLKGPSKSAQPLLAVNTKPTFYCDTRGTLTPTLVVYDDGVVLSTDGLGAYCDKVPKVSLGWMDPSEARTMLDSYFASPESRVDMSDLRVTDLPYSSIDYHSSDGPKSVEVYGLGFDDAVPFDQRAARRALGSLLDTLYARAVSDRWVPDRVVITTAGDKPSHTTDPAPGLAKWPIPVTPDVRTVIDGSSSSKRCATITGADATTVLAAQKDRSAQAGWIVDGKQQWFAIGIVLPTFRPCPG